MNKTASVFATLTLLTLLTAIALGEAPNAKVKITDPKLGTVRYGIETVEYWLERMKPGDQTRAKKIDRDLMKVIERYKRVKGADQEQSKVIVRRIQAAAKLLQTKASPPPSSNATSKNNQPAAAATGKPQTADSSVTKTNKKFSQDQAIEIIQTLQKKYHEEVLVPKLNFKDELTAELVDQFTEDVAKVRAEIAKDLPTVRSIAKDHRSASYLLNLLETETERKVKRNINRATSLIDGKMKFVASYLEKQASLDRTKDAYIFDNSKLMSKNEKQFASMSRTLEQAIRLQKSLGLTDTYTPAREKFNSDLKKWRSLAGAATTGRQLPKDIGDDKLRKIAAEVLKKEKYGIGKVERLIVNAKVRPGERIEHKAFAGKLETIVRQWEEYQVATVEAENGKYYLYFNTLRKFSRAPRTTPVNEWILSKRIKSGEVLATNL